MILILSTERDSDALVEEAIREAQEASEPLQIYYVMETEIPQAVSSWFMYLGFMGEKPAEELKGVILEELRRRARERVDELEQRLREEGIPGEVHLVEGDPRRVRETLRAQNPGVRLLP